MAGRNTILLFITTLFCLVSNSPVYAAQGDLLWKFRTGGYAASVPAMGVDGTIYFGSSDKNLYALYPDGSLKWTYTAGEAIDDSPAVGADGTIYFGSFDTYVYALNPNGSEKWKYKTDGFDPFHTGYWIRWDSICRIIR